MITRPGHVTSYGAGSGGRDRPAAGRAGKTPASLGNIHREGTPLHTP